MQPVTCTHIYCAVFENLAVRMDKGVLLKMLAGVKIVVIGPLRHTAPNEK